MKKRTYQKPQVVKTLSQSQAAQVLKSNRSAHAAR